MGQRPGVVACNKFDCSIGSKGKEFQPTPRLPDLEDDGRKGAHGVVADQAQHAASAAVGAHGEEGCMR
eukprot:171499-Lingulodinium_polyedra.AAC.1